MPGEKVVDEMMIAFQGEWLAIICYLGSRPVLHSVFQAFFPTENDSKEKSGVGIE